MTLRGGSKNSGAGKKPMPSLPDKLLAWIAAHKLDVIIASALLIIAGTVSAINMGGYPQRFEDEGTYVSQAWAVEKQGTLTHYTYWYDHPPVGWIQIAAYTAATHAFERYGSAITAGREFMLLIHLATIVLLFALARRMKIGSLAAGFGVLLYALSPLSVEFGRYVLLDNIALPWVLAAFFLALSPRRNLMAAVGAAFCMAIAILSKETFATLLPVLIYALWRASDKRNRRYMFTAFGVVFVMVSAAYVLYAALKNELFPGVGHVSLLGTAMWQISGREGSGSIFDPGSGTRGLIGYWLNIDWWFMAAGVVSMVIAFFYRNLRIAAFGLLIGLLLLFRTGYLPYPYIISLMPFAALTIAGVLDHWVIMPLTGKKAARNLAAHHFKQMAAIAVGIVVLFGSIVFVAPAWQPKLAALTSVDNDASSRQAVDWVAHNITRENRVVVESALWTDLENQGFNQPQPVWLYKTETDPAVAKEIGGWQGIDYVVLNGPTIGARTFDQSFPTVSQAIKHGQLVTTFGQDNQKILIYQVQH